VNTGSSKRSNRFLWLGPLLALLLSSCHETEYFVLVHGATMGAWVWDQVGSFLALGGADVQVVDLPAHGDDMTPVDQVTMDAYVARVASVVDASPAPVHLVGHSLAGMVISQYAELEPEKLESLIYLAAFVPQDGETALQLLGQDTGSQIGAYIIANEDGTLGLPQEQLGPLFCADCNETQLAPLLAGARNEPLVPMVTPVRLTPERFGSVPKRALFTANDVAISYGFQQQMASTVSMECTRTLQTSHTPQLSRPADVAVNLGMLTHCTPGDPPVLQLIRNGNVVSGTIDSSAGEQWFRIPVKDAGTLTIDLAISGSTDLDWFVSTESDPGTVLAQGYTANNPEAGIYSAAANTNYLLKVNGYQGATGSYTLTVTAPATTLDP